MKIIVLFFILLFPVISWSQVYVSPRLGFSFNQFFTSQSGVDNGIYSTYHMGLNVGYETRILNFGIGVQSGALRGVTRNQPLLQSDKNGPSFNPFVFIGKNFYFTGSYLGLDLNFGPVKHASDAVFRSSRNYWGFSFGGSITFNIKVTDKAFVTLGTSPHIVTFPVADYMHVYNDQGDLINKRISSTAIPFHVGTTFKF